jgi:hypothetical protein
MFQLRVLSGSKAGAVHQLVPGQVFVVGRGAEANLSVPDDPTLSRNHADIVIEGGQAVLRNRSQHGSLVGGQVVQGTSPIAMGQEFQVGGTRLILEPLPAGAAAPAASGGKPAPQAVGTPVGAAAGGAAAGGKPDAAAALAAAKNFGGAGGQAKITHTGPGFPFGDLVKGGLGIVKANLIPSLALAGPFVFLVVLILGLQFGGRFLPNFILSLVGIIMGLAGLAVSIGQPILTFNYLAGVREYQATGKPIGLFSLISFSNIVQRVLTGILVGVSMICCYVPVLLTCWAIPIIIDKPEVGFMNAIKASVAYGKKNIVNTLILLIVLGIVNTIGQMLCGVGMLITMPTALAAFYLAYDLKKGEIAAAAAEAGIAL